MTPAKKADQQASSRYSTLSDLLAAAHSFNKQSRILAHLLAGNSLNRVEAERMGDHCLPSTISALASRYGVLFQSEPEQMPNRFGGVTRVVRHKLAASQRDHARKALMRMMDNRVMRGAA